MRRHFFLVHASVARHAVLIQDGSDIAGEVHFAIGMVMNECGNKQYTQEEQPEHPDAGRF